MNTTPDTTFNKSSQSDETFLKLEKTQEITSKINAVLEKWKDKLNTVTEIDIRLSLRNLFKLPRLMGSGLEGDSISDLVNERKTGILQLGKLHLKGPGNEGLVRFSGGLEFTLGVTIFKDVILVFDPTKEFQDREKLSETSQQEIVMAGFPDFQGIRPAEDILYAVYDDRHRESINELLNKYPELSKKLISQAEFLQTIGESGQISEKEKITPPSPVDIKAFLASLSDKDISAPMFLDFYSIFEEEAGLEAAELLSNYIMDLNRKSQGQALEFLLQFDDKKIDLLLEFIDTKYQPLSQVHINFAWLLCHSYKTNKKEPTQKARSFIGTVAETLLHISKTDTLLFTSTQPKEQFGFIFLLDGIDKKTAFSNEVFWETYDLLKLLLDFQKKYLNPVIDGNEKKKLNNNFVTTLWSNVRDTLTQRATKNEKREKSLSRDLKEGLRNLNFLVKQSRETLFHTEPELYKEKLKPLLYTFNTLQPQIPQLREYYQKQSESSDDATKLESSIVLHSLTAMEELFQSVESQ